MGKKPQMQTLEVADAPEVAGEGKPRRNALLGDKPLVDAAEGISSLHESLLEGAKLSNDGPFLGRRVVSNGVAGPYIWETYGQVCERVKNLGSALCKLGVKPHDAVGLFSINRPEWVIGEHSCYMYNFTTVPLYDTLGDQAIQYIIEQTKMSHVLLTLDKAEKLVKLRETVPTVRVLIIFDDNDEAISALAENAEGIQVLSLKAAEEMGREGGIEEPASKAGLDDIFTICYTSGTTGLPKGVVLTHRNILAFLTASSYMAKHGKIFPYSKEDIHISYLPLAHVFERVIQALLTSVGGRIGFYQGDTLKLLDDVAELRPTLFISVPRLFNRIYDKVWAGVKAKGGVAAQLFNMAFRQKISGLSRGTVHHWLWDRLVFGAVRARLGGRVKYMITGSAPISAEVVDFLRVCFSADVYEGYGQTENTAGLSITERGECESGHVGTPMVCCEVKLVDLPEMNYTSEDKPYPRGEICVRGNHVFREYYNSPEKTAETIDSDGWVHTGDVGMWDNKGRLKIIDRAKNIFKLAQGEYIAPERIEAVYQKHPLVAQTFIYGDSLQATLVGIIVPDEEQLPKFAATHGLGDKSFAEICANEDIRQHILKQLNTFGRENDLKGFENVKNIHLESTPFSIENELLTPTMKLKRHQAKVKYQEKLDQMYAEIA